MRQGERLAGKARFQRFAGLLLASVTLPGLAWPGLVHAQAVAANARNFDLPAGPLGSSLANFGAQSGLQVSLDAADVQGLQSVAVAGTMAPARALAQMLAGSGYTGRIDGNVVTLVPVPKAAPATVQLGALEVDGARTALTAGEERDARGADDVYDRDTTTTYMGKDEVERYKGVNPSDMLKGMLGVYSGDPRNGGAIDPSIRGISGPGRVPVIIDGTEQALTVWRGYNGASNRAYIDPSLVSGLQVQKGPVSERGVDGAIGGAVVVHTLDADDILRKGKHFGIEMKLEGGDNSTSPRWPTSLNGKDYRTVPGFPEWPSFPYGDPSLTVTPRTSANNHLLSLGDKAVRVAAAARLGKVDLFGAYAYRTRGNYFSGENESAYYTQSALSNNPGNFIKRMGLQYLPGNEVTNTSSETSSWLAKLVWHINDASYLKAGFRDTSATYGDILSSRLVTGGVNVGAIQWPSSHIHTQAYNLDYRLQPGLWWLDLKANAWGTHTRSATNSLGGFPNAATTDNPILTNTAVAHNRNDRYGVIASNQFKLGSRLDLLVEGNWQHEVLRSSDQLSDTASCNFCQYPRSGHRQEYKLSFKSEWRPTSFLKFNAGVTYSGYVANDDLLNTLVATGQAPTTYATIGYKTNVRFNVTDQASWQTYLTNLYTVQYRAFGYDAAKIASLVAARPYLPSYNYSKYSVGGIGSFYADANGKVTRAQNPCLNGAYASLPGYTSCSITSIMNGFTATDADAHNSGHNWAPNFSATLYLSSNSRIYGRYTEAYRYPSMFESTLGFSASYNPLSKLKPEHMHATEVAFVQDLRPLLHLHGDQKADFKLTWYRNVTSNVIDRDRNLLFSNRDKQIISGIEAQARFDNGRLFADLGYAHTFTNKTCDQSTASTIDSGYTSAARIPDCVKYGFYGGYLLTQGTPDDSFNATLGARFFKRRLETGTRLTWFSAYNNPLLDVLLNGTQLINGYGLNVPYTWGSTLTVDAYVRFKVNENFTAEVNGTNLTDRYYADPLTRSLNPAPGRTLRLNLTAKL